MRTIDTKQGWVCALAVLVWMAAFRPCLEAQPQQPLPQQQRRVGRLSPKVMEVLNMPPVELKADDPPLLRLKKERFNAALNEAKARLDLYKRGLTRLPELIDVGERLFGAEVDLYNTPEEKVRVIQHYLDIYNDAEANLQKQVKEGLATQADLERLRYDKTSVEIALLNAKGSQAQPPAPPAPQASPTP